MYEFEIKLTMNDKEIIHKIVTTKKKKIPEMYLDLTQELINTTLTVKRLK